MPARFNGVVRTALLASRWAMAPLCVGLIVALLVLIAQFFRELAHMLADFPGLSGGGVTLAVLKLVDLVLVANLVLMIVVAGIEVFLPSAAAEGGRGEGAGIAEFAALKPRLFASIAAIAAIDLLESFVNVEAVDKTALLWETLILLAFVVAGVLLAAMERLGAERR